MCSRARAVGKAGANGRPYQELAGELRSDIAAGRLPAGGYLPGERQLAETHAVAPMTARRALKKLQAEGLIAAEARRGWRVLARANDPDRGAPIAYILSPHPGPQLWDDLHRTMVSSFQKAAAAMGWSLLAVGTDGRTPGEILEQLRTARACGAILDTLDRALIEAARRAGLPTLTVDDWRMDAEVDAVAQDGFRGGILAATWLAERGHKRIGWLGPVGVSRQGLERFGGASAALAAREIEIPSRLRKTLQDPESPEGVKLAREMLSLKERPTAVLALWQGCTASLSRAAGELGLVPGKDFEMVGWSTEEGYATDFLPRFASGPVPPAVVWSVAAMGLAVVDRLAERRAKPDMPSVVIKVPTRLKLPGEDQ